MFNTRIAGQWQSGALHKYGIGTGLETEDTGALSGSKEGRIIEGISISIATCRLSIPELHLVEEVNSQSSSS